MPKRTSQSPIPDHAVEVITNTYDSGAKRRASYFVDGKEIGYRDWEENGVLEAEGGLKDGLKHGAYRTFIDGQLNEDGFYIEGKEHGETAQYVNGQRIGSYVMDHGTGVDLWYGYDYDEGKITLSEERHYLNGDRHGYERWWNGDDQTVYEESHFNHGIEHGIFRQWNRKGRLSRGYPRYFVNGQRVTKRQYLRACHTDPTLPAYNDADNHPSRRLPNL